MIELVNPKTQLPLFLDKNENILKDKENNKYPIVNDIPRFISSDNYASNFGFQWNTFAKTQIDTSYNNFELSKKRFFKQFGKNEKFFENKNILEVGSGAGRFSNVVLRHTKANLYSTDISNSVDVNLENNKEYFKRLNIYQCNINEMPFKENTFDIVFCFGVLQHTPKVSDTIKNLLKYAKKDALVVVDFYPIKGWWTKIHAKYFFRLFTKKISNDTLLKIIKFNIRWLIPLYLFFKTIKLGFLTRFLPISDFDSKIYNKLTKKEREEWIILDTFDQYSPKYDQPQKIEDVRKIFEKFKSKVIFSGLINYDDQCSAVVRAIK